MKRSLRLSWRLLRLHGVLLYGIYLALWLHLRERLNPTTKQAFRQQLSQDFLGKLSRALPFQVTVIGQACPQPALWLSNHVSWTDIALLGQLAPISFLAKAEVRRWPLAGWLADRAGTLFIQRGAGRTAEVSAAISQRLRAGQSLALFPEGTSTDGRQLRKFHARLLAAGQHAQAPIQPVAIAYRRHGQPDWLAPFIGDDSLPQHVIRLLRADIAEVQIKLLPWIQSEMLSRDQLAQLSHAAISQALFAEKHLTETA